MTDTVFIRPRSLLTLANEPGLFENCPRILMAAVDHDNRRIFVVMHDLTPRRLDFGWFDDGPGDYDPLPCFDEVQIVDSGATLRLGLDYEVSSQTIFEEEQGGAHGEV